METRERVMTTFRLDRELARKFRADCAGRGEKIQDRMAKLIAAYLRRVKARKKKIDATHPNEVTQ